MISFIRHEKIFSLYLIQRLFNKRKIFCSENRIGIVVALFLKKMTKFSILKLSTKSKYI